MCKGRTREICSYYKMEEWKNIFPHEVLTAGTLIPPFTLSNWFFSCEYIQERERREREREFLLFKRKQVLIKANAIRRIIIHSSVQYI